MGSSCFARGNEKTVEAIRIVAGKASVVDIE